MKRDGSTEPFDESKLTGAIWGAMARAGGEYQDARELARAVQCYLHRAGWPCVASVAIFDMTVKILRRVRFTGAARAMVRFHQRRRSGRKLLRVAHDGGQITAWDKAWAAKLACHSWQLQPRTGRIVASLVEKDLLRQPGQIVERGEVIEQINECVAAHGLADAVLMRPPVA